MTLQEAIARTRFDPGFWTQENDAWVAFLDREQTIVSSNDSSSHLPHLDNTPLVGRKIEEVLNLGHLAPLLVTGFCFRGEPLTIEGHKYSCSYVPTFEGKAATGGFLSLTSDPQNLAADSREELQNMVKSLGPFLDIASDGLIIVDRHGIITLVNQPFADVVGTRAQDMIGKHVLKAYPNSKLSRLPVVMETGRPEIGEAHTLNGREVVVSRYPLFKDDKLIGALGKILFRDVREVTLLANKLQAAAQRDKSAAVSKNCDFHYDVNNILGQSKVMRELKTTLMRVAERGSNVLLAGESGTGKELFAHAIHAGSKRRYGPFIKVNCAAIPEHLMESELFGYVEGAFTGARKEGQQGKFALAHQGTIFLDEISDMSISMQAKLLRVLQEKEVTPLGSSSTNQIDVRVVAASNVNLEKLVRDGKFRKDLYYRLNIVSLAIPPLRERAEDIFLITKHLIDLFNIEFGLNIQGLEAEAWEVIRSYDFPGNIRELRNIIESAYNLVMGPLIRRDDLPGYVLQASCHLPVSACQGVAETDFSASIGKRPLTKIMDEIEKNLLEEAIRQSGGNKLQAASLLGISRPGLYKKLAKYQIQ